MAKEIIGRYQIRSEIGRGGMAAVYLAYDPSFRRNVAIKLVSVNLQENLMFRERFEREAQLIARIEHPAIVPVYDFGDEDNQPYLVMRYMPGGALVNKIKEGPLSLAYASQIIMQIAPALDAVHSQGIVHRDLKPANILLDGFGNPAISDFGIAHFAQATTDLTGSAVIGTPSYMSPEQVRGDEDIDGRSDIYALGVILFEMLTGSGPFRASTPMSVALKHLTDPIPSIRSARPELPEEVDSILTRAMAKDREMRYSTALELARELQRVTDSVRDRADSAPQPIKIARNEAAATEVDTEGDSNPSTIPPQADVLQVLPQPSSTALPRKRSMVPQIAGISGVGLCLLLLCGAVGLLGAWSWLGRRGLFPVQNLTAGPTLPVNTTEIPEVVVLFSDDFTDPSNGWPTEQNTRGEYSYRSDGYHILVNEIGAALWAKTSEKYGDVSLYVDAKPIVENKDGYYGLLCRIQDNQDFYYFVIQSNGAYTIGKHKNTQFQSLFSDGWRQSDAIHPDQTNRVRADCTADTLRLYVNDLLLGEVTDSGFTSGFGGILVASLNSSGFEVKFNNFLITEPAQ